MTTTTPEIGGLTDLARALGLTKQRVSQLAARDDFPAPVHELTAPVASWGRARAWRVAEVVAWNDARLGRRGGGAS